MNNEETIIMQPKNEANKNAESNNVTSEKKATKNNTAGRIAATAAAGVFGGAAGGAASVAAATMMGNQEPVEEEAQEVIAEEAKPEPKVEPEPVVEAKADETEEIPVTVHESQEPDYANQQGADPVVQEPEVTPVSNETEPEVQILGVYERTNDDGVHQEVVFLTDGEEIAGVLDADGDGVADVIGIDHNHNEQFDEGEIYDISEQHVEMEQFEQEYLAQQQEEIEQHDTFAYEASDDQDYNNDVDYATV